MLSDSERAVELARVPYFDVALDAQTDHGLAWEPQLERVGHGHDLDDTALEQPLNALSHRCFGQTDGLRDRRVGPSSVLLQLFDNGLRDLIEDAGRWHRAFAWGHLAIMAPTLTRCKRFRSRWPVHPRNPWPMLDITDVLVSRKRSRPATLSAPSP